MGSEAIQVSWDGKQSGKASQSLEAFPHRKGQSSCCLTDWVLKFGEEEQELDSPLGSESLATYYLCDLEQVI